MLRRRCDMRRNRDGEWRREKVAVMHGAALSVLGGEGETVSCPYGLPHGMPKTMQSRSEEE
jgi:hypothetical protein